MKRVVTGHDASGKAVFASIGEPGHRLDVTSFSWREMWGTYPEDALPVADPTAEPTRDPRFTCVYPRVGQSLFRIVEFRPEEGAARSGGPLWDEAELAAIEREMPGTLAHLEPDAPGMHTTDSVDYGIVLEGRIGLELDDGAVVELEAGDVVVQNGTRHAWRPRERTRMAFVMIGMTRKEP